MVIRVMKHPTAGGHALGRAPRRRPQLVPTPTRAPSLGRTATEAPAAPLRRGGSLGQCAANFPAASQGSSRARAPPPPSPSHLPYHSIPPPRLHSGGPASGAAPHTGSGERPSSLSLSSSATATALTPETELAGAARLSSLRVPWLLLLRGAGPASQRVSGRGRRPRKGRSSRAD